MTDTSLPGATTPAPVAISSGVGSIPLSSAPDLLPSLYQAPWIYAAPQVLGISSAAYFRRTLVQDVKGASPHGVVATGHEALRESHQWKP